jgi:hypothetical protein
VEIGVIESAVATFWVAVVRIGEGAIATASALSSQQLPVLCSVLCGVLVYRYKGVILVIMGSTQGLPSIYVRVSAARVIYVHPKVRM